MKNQNGITLIALVITIIVLLILAGVSISAITGENGVVDKAKEAAEKTETAQKEEEDILKGYEEELDKALGTEEDEETECTHENKATTGEDNEDGTHTVTCSDCNEAVTEDHVDSDGNSECDVCTATIESV